MRQTVNIFWFRRDLRLHDNAGLYHALKDSNPVVPVFIFDRNILDELEEKRDSRVGFIHHAIAKIQEFLASIGSSVEVCYGFPEEVFAKLHEKYNIEKVFANHDYEPYAKVRDESVKKILAAKGISFHTSKDHVIFERDEIVKDDSSPYVVFTPYSRKWLASLNDSFLHDYTATKHFGNFYKSEPHTVPSLKSMGFQKGMFEIPPLDIPVDIIRNYKNDRDYPGIDGTTRLGIHLRFGTISVRELVRACPNLSEVYLKELIWREFYQMILSKFPKVGLGSAFKKEYDRIEWRNNEKEYALWCAGQTGYPIVDAGMRQLNQTGFMHNRVRMITASFLAKHLLVDWRRGEAYFAGKLLDYELASNNGGWQWAAGSGCDAAPYFRIFNPSLQTKKFDPGLQYVRRWVPEFEDFSYPSPVVDHGFARKRALEVYGKALKREL